jgi:polar amino acid transport system substrate-binding protein
MYPRTRPQVTVNRWLKTLYLATFLIGTFFSFPQLAIAQSSKVIGLTTGDGYPPYVDWKTPTGGIATEVVRNVVTRMGFEPRFSSLPWARGYKLMLKGDYTATFPYIRTPTREAEVAFSEPLFGISSHIFARAGSPMKFEDIGDLKGYSTCNYVGSALPTSVQTQIAEGLIRVNEVSSLSTCFKLLELGRVDFVTVNSLAGSAIACEHPTGSHQFLISEKPAETLYLHLVVALANADARGFLENFNVELLKFKSTKDYLAVKTKWTYSVGTEKPVRGFRRIDCSLMPKNQ